MSKNENQMENETEITLAKDIPFYIGKTSHV